MENQTAEFGLAESITDGIIDQFNGAGILLLEDSDAANSILSGKIIKVTEGPVSYKHLTLPPIVIV